MTRTAACALAVALVASACGQSGVAPPPSPSQCYAVSASRWPRVPPPRRPVTDLVVRLRAGVPIEQAEDVARGAGGSLVKVRRRVRALVVRPEPRTGVAALATRLASDPRVLRVGPDVRLHALRTPDDPLFAQQWGLQRIQAPAAWETTPGNGVAVAVVDTGIRSHADVPSVAPGDGYDFVQEDPDPTDPGDPTYDCTSHGTMVASVLGALTNNARGMAGVTWGPGGVRLVVARALDTSGGSFVDVAEGILWAVQERGARVVNLSLGADDPNTSCPPELQQAIEQVSGQAVVVAAAGNTTDTNPDRQGVVCPANLDKVLAVAATDPENRVTFYSRRGPEVDLAAPGGRGGNSCSTEIVTASPSSSHPEGYPCAAGTSFAAPHVAGVAALLLSQNPGWTPFQVRQRLKRTAQDVESSGRDEDTGCGLVRADRALSGETDPTPACP